MQRPVLNPSFLDDPDFDAPKPRRQWRRMLLRIVSATARGVWRAMLWRPLGHRPEPAVNDPDQPVRSVGVRTLLQRLTFVPIVLTLIVAAMVYRGTHPAPFDPGGTPAEMGIYYQPVAMVAADGQRLEGWLIPAIDARTIVQQQEAVLRRQHAAVVLVHDQQSTRAQMLPLVQPLHQAGMVVLVVGVRGEGTRYASSRTFGLREAMDIHAGVQMLRRRSSVDPAHIAVIGSGTGATAAVLAAGDDRSIAALVLDSPLQHSEQVLSHIGPAHDWLGWLRPVCKWAFEFSHAVDADDVNLSRHHHVLNHTPILMFDGPSHAPATWTPQTIDQTLTFLQQNLPSQSAVAATR